MTQQTTGTMSKTDVLAFLTKLNGWAQQLSAAERTCLEAVLLRAAVTNEGEVEGFLMSADPYEPGVRPAPSPDSAPGGFGGGTGGTFLSALTPSLVNRLTSTPSTTTTFNFVRS